MTLGKKIDKFLRKEGVIPSYKNYKTLTIKQLMIKFCKEQELSIQEQEMIFERNRMIKNEGTMELENMLLIVCDRSKETVNFCKMKSKERNYVYNRIGFTYLVRKYLKGMYSYTDIARTLHRDRSLINYYVNKLEGDYYKDIKARAEIMYKKHK